MFGLSELAPYWTRFNYLLHDFFVYFRFTRFEVNVINRLLDT